MKFPRQQTRGLLGSLASYIAIRIGDVEIKKIQHYYNHLSSPFSKDFFINSVLSKFGVPKIFSFTPPMHEGYPTDIPLENLRKRFFRGIDLESIGREPEELAEICLWFQKTLGVKANGVKVFSDTQDRLFMGLVFANAQLEEADRNAYLDDFIAASPATDQCLEYCLKVLQNNFQSEQVQSMADLLAARIQLRTIEM